MKIILVLSGLVAGVFTGCGSREEVRSDHLVVAEAVKQLRARGHRVSFGVHGGGSGVEGTSCCLVTPIPYAANLAISSADARALNLIPDLVEIRILPNGGPPDEFWEALEAVDSLRDLAVHYGLNEKGVRSLAKFPRLESFTVWGGDSWGQSTSLRELPSLKALRILHFEESIITTEDFRHIKEMCPQLEEFRYDYELLPADLEILRSMRGLKNVSAFNFEMEAGEVVRSSL